MRMSEGQEQLIEAVKKRPIIYSKYHPSFSNRKLKLSLWYDVCNEVVPNWKNMTCGQRGEKVCEIQRRWKTLRDGFSRELQFQQRYKLKKARGELVKKRKIYGYFNQLKFLLKQKREPLEVQGNDEADSEENGSDLTENEISIIQNEENTNQSFKTELGNSFYVDINDIHDQKVFETNKLTVDIEKNIAEDEDRLFCLSLVPSFKKMTEKQKYDARIGIMQVLSDVRFKNGSSAINSETPN